MFWNCQETNEWVQGESKWRATKWRIKQLLWYFCQKQDGKALIAVRHFHWLKRQPQVIEWPSPPKGQVPTNQTYSLSVIKFRLDQLVNKRKSKGVISRITREGEVADAEVYQEAAVEELYPNRPKKVRPPPQISHRANQRDRASQGPADHVHHRLWLTYISQVVISHRARSSDLPLPRNCSRKLILGVSFQVCCGNLSGRCNDPAMYLWLFYADLM